jgi:nucleobase:cation symporter-1, NCS1 family
VALSLFPSMVHGFNNQMSVMGAFFAPVAGVLVVDYLALRRMKVDVPALFRAQGRYWCWGGFNRIAIGWVVAGCAVTFAVPDAWIKTVSSGIITGLGYLATMAIARARSRIVAAGTAPVEVATDAAPPEPVSAPAPAGS